MSRPGFLIIGAQKAGTTSLYEYMCHHPQIVGAEKKEIHFFSLYYSRGIDWYLSQFPRSLSADQVTGEATPYYLFHPYSPQRIYATFPDIKIIVLLRDPVDRAISHFMHARARGFEHRPLLAALYADIESQSPKQLECLKTSIDLRHQRNSYVQRGFYSVQLDRYFALFPSSSILLLESTQLFHEPEKALQRVFDHLEVAAARVSHNFPVMNQGSGFNQIDEVELRAARAWLEEIYSKDRALLETKYGLVI